MDHMNEMFDWSPYVPQSSNFLTEEDFKKSCTYKIITGTFQDPLLTSESDDDSKSESAQNPAIRTIISYSCKPKACKAGTKKDFQYVPGLCPLPYFPSLSSLNVKTQLACLKVLAAKDTAVKSLPLPPPNNVDLRKFEKFKETIAKEQKEFLECAKQLWLSNHCLRVLRHPTIVEAVEKKDLEVQSAKIRQLPQNYEFFEVVNITSVINVNLIHRQNIFQVRDVPQIKIPIDHKVHLTRERKPRRKQCDATLSPVRDLYPDNVTTPGVHMSERGEIIEFLSGVGAEHNVDMVVAGSALACLQDNRNSWLVPVTVLPDKHEVGGGGKMIVIGGEMQVPAPTGITKMERAYTDLLRQMLINHQSDQTVSHHDELDQKGSHHSGLDQTVSHHSKSETNGPLSVEMESLDTNFQNVGVATDLFSQPIIAPSIITKKIDNVADIHKYVTNIHCDVTNIHNVTDINNDVTDIHNVTDINNDVTDIHNVTDINNDVTDIQNDVTDVHNNMKNVINDGDSDSDVDVLIIVEDEEMADEAKTEVRESSVSVSSEQDTQNKRPSLYEEYDMIVQKSSKTYVGPTTRRRAAKEKSISSIKRDVKNHCYESLTERMATKRQERFNSESSNDSTIIKCGTPKQPNRKSSTASNELKEAGDSDSDEVTFDATRVLRSGRMLMDPSIKPTPIKSLPPSLEPTSPKSQRIKRNAQEHSSKRPHGKTGPWRFSCDKPVYNFYSMNKLADGLPKIETSDISHQGDLPLNEKTDGKPSPENKVRQVTNENTKTIKVCIDDTDNTSKPNSLPKAETSDTSNQGHSPLNKKTDGKPSPQNKVRQVTNENIETTEVCIDDTDNTFKPISDFNQRSFDKWELCDSDGKNNISMIVHCSRRLRTCDGESVLAVPILEYQADIAATRLRRVVSRALALYLRGPQTKLLTARVVPASSELLSLEWNTLESLMRSENCSLSPAFSLLHRTLSTLQRLRPGNYMLRHDAKQTFTHVYIYKECAPFDVKAPQDFAGQRINITHLSTWCSTDDATPPSAPVLCATILPWHRHHRVLPLTFMPPDIKESKQYSKMRKNDEKKKIFSEKKLSKKKKKKKK